MRDFDRPNYPGFWESGAGSSVLKGERVTDGAKRELLEKTGISKDNVKLQEGETVAFCRVDEREFAEIFYSDQYVDGPRERLCEFVEHGFRKE